MSGYSWLFRAAYIKTFTRQGRCMGDYRDHSWVDANLIHCLINGGSLTVILHMCNKTRSIGSQRNIINYKQLWFRIKCSSYFGWSDCCSSRYFGILECTYWCKSLYVWWSPVCGYQCNTASSKRSYFSWNHTIDTSQVTRTWYTSKAIIGPIVIYDHLYKNCNFQMI